MSTFSLIAIALLSFAVAALSGYIVIPRLKKLHIGQTISEYVKEHQGKANREQIDITSHLLGWRSQETREQSLERTLRRGRPRALRVGMYCCGRQDGESPESEK